MSAVRMYSTCTAVPRSGPRLAAVSTTASVCPVIGTGEPGTGTATWASSAVNSTPSATRPASRARTAGTRSARTSGRDGRAGDEAATEPPRTTECGATPQVTGSLPYLAGGLRAGRRADAGSADQPHRGVDRHGAVRDVRAGQQHAPLGQGDGCVGEVQPAHQPAPPPEDQAVS